MEKYYMDNLLERAEEFVDDLVSELQYIIRQVKVRHEEEDREGVEYWLEELKNVLKDKSEEVKNI